MAELDALQRQGVVLARSLALAEVEFLQGRGQVGNRALSQETMKQLLPLVGYGSVLRARVFQPDGRLAADTARDGLSSGSVELRIRRNRDMHQQFGQRITNGLDRLSQFFGNDAPLPVVKHRRLSRATEFKDVANALTGGIHRNVFLNSQRQMVLSVALPVQDVRMVRGALLLTTSGGRIEQEIRAVQWVFLQIFAFVTLVTIGLAFYLARSITLPISKLASAADTLRNSHDDTPLARLPDRKDEIGDLSQALSEMTDELQRRIQATAGFAADVSHELKNPLTSLRSAVETVSRIEDPEQQRKLMSIILADVGRLDRLITDISLASRIDVELNRLLPEASDFSRFVENWVMASQQRWSEGTLHFENKTSDETISVRMFSGRIAQILDNILQNAISFSPEGGKITVRLDSDKKQAQLIIEDEGPGIPEAKLEAIFDRFYTERPQGEAFGNHSGLGLSISRQIAQAHNGTLHAENRVGGGARFSLTLPVSPDKPKSPKD
ncbi:MAG: ATP-binding protein [Candidatus Puniceispirillaceae bacterium]